MAAPTTCQRSLKLDLFLPEESATSRQAVIDSVRRYRAVARQCFSIMACSQAAGARIEYEPDGPASESGLSITPDGARAAQVLAAATGKDGKALAYQLRDYVLREQCPSWFSFVWDSLRRDLATAWTSKDPEFTRAGRGWLVLQGGRGLAQFNYRGIGFPVATARPRLDDHGLTLRWDREIGTVGFRMKRLDGGRWRVYRSLREGAEGWSPGTVYLSERDGQLFATVTYQKPDDRRDLDPARLASVRFRGDDPDTLVGISGPDGTATYDRISAPEAHAWLLRHRRKMIDLEARRAACGNPRRKWGFKPGYRDAQAAVANATAQRARGVQARNHAWTRRVIDRCVGWGCGTVAVEPLPAEIAGEPWNWSGFKAALEYKAAEVGIAVVWR